ncbi:hypothetical protein, partial [Faecalibaculum rodentium]|uniref:hypothetical protein n=5 Tax=Faecalibaculum rodentium TaxID=1702221 RepID=UPI00259C97EF
QLCGKTGNERHIVYGFQRVTKRQDSTESVKIQPVSQGAGFFVFGMIITDTCKVRTDFRQKALTSGKSPGSQGLSSVGIPGCGLLPFTLADNLYGP